MRFCLDKNDYENILLVLYDISIDSMKTTSPFSSRILREKAPTNKTPARTKSMDKDIWVVGTSNQLFIRSS